MPVLYMVLMLLMIAVVFIGTYIVYMSRLEKKLNNPQPARFMMVLGGKVKPDGSLSPVLARRTALAADLFSRGFATAVVASGGKGSDEPHSEAEAIKSELERLGVPGVAVLIENTSKNTWENIAFSTALLEKAGALEPSIEKGASLLIVSSCYHLPRAAYIAYQQGWRLITCAGAESPPHLLLLNRTREVAAWTKHFLTRGGVNIK